MNLDFDTKSAWLRLAQQSQDEIMSRFCTVLIESIPSQITVTYERKTLFGPKQIKSVILKIGVEEFKIASGVDVPTFTMTTVEQQADPFLALKIPAPHVFKRRSGKRDDTKLRPAVAITSRLGGMEIDRGGVTFNVGGGRKMVEVEQTLKASDWMEKLVSAVSAQSDFAEDFVRSMQSM